MSTPSPPEGYASDPQLIMLWTAPLDLTGAGMKAGGTESKMPPESSPVTVDLATLQSAQQAMLDAGSTIVSTYNPVEKEVQQAISEGTIFGQQATYNTKGVGTVPLTGGAPSGGAGATRAVPDYNVPDPNLQSAAQQFAAQMNPSMTRVIAAVANAMSAIGAYIAMVNNAGQIYTASDKHSKAPAAPTVGGGS
jgi:hypothetical protein